jgi:hypothetical protein
MNRNKLKTYAPLARREFIQAVTDRAAFYGLTEKKIEPLTEQGDVAVIGGQGVPQVGRRQTQALGAADRPRRLPADDGSDGLHLVQPLRRHPLHGTARLPGPRLPGAFSLAPAGERVGVRGPRPRSSNMPNMSIFRAWKKKRSSNSSWTANKEAELYRMPAAGPVPCPAQSDAVSVRADRRRDRVAAARQPAALGFPDPQVGRQIHEDDWQEVEIIGWLYQFYISEKKDEVIGKVVKSEDIPAATQLFTPNWIVKYLVQNSLGRQWMATYPDSPLKAQMEYYIEPAEQTPEVQEQLKAITPTELNPEELTLLDPACGSGHILVEAYDLLKAIYQERGYRPEATSPG